ncbi:mechanosensitive ion channel family protein [Vibrio mediterranei]
MSLTHRFRWLTPLLLCVLCSPSVAGTSRLLSNTSSPQQTLNSFIQASDELIQYWQQEELRTIGAELALAQAIRTMDLSLVPNRTRTVVVMERIILLREIIDRLDSEALKALPKSSSYDFWRFDNTDITITKLTDGERAGQYVFSANTIQQLPRWYRTLQPLPYNSSERLDYYTVFIHSPGPLFPKQFIALLPDKVHILYGPLPLWQWIAVLLLASTCYASIKMSVYLGQRWNQHWAQKNLKWKVGKLISLISCGFILYLTRQVMDQGIWLTGGVYQFITTCFFLAQFYILSWLIMATFKYGAALYAFKRNNGKHVDSSLITVLSRIFGGLTIIILGIYVIEFMGFSISPLLAGIGVGGLAVALAIRPVLENVINGLTLYADGGIKIGELCRYGDKLGTIESIGLRSTRIRTLERSLITIPNSEFANMEIDNLERRDKRRMEHTLRIRPELTQEQLKVLIVSIRRVLLQHPKVEPEPIRVRFCGIGEFAILVNTMCYIHCKDNEEFLSIQEDILFLMAQKIETIGAQLAFSTQYQFAGHLSETDQGLAEEAKQIVENWHTTNNYPFPDFSYEYKHEIKSSTVFPANTSSVNRHG